MKSSAWICSSRLKLVALNPQVNEKCKNYFNVVGVTSPNLYQHKHCNQAVKAFFPWVRFKAFF